MKKILIAIFILCSVQSFGQATFRIKDSTLRFMTGTLTSKVPQFVRPMYGQELSRNNSSTLKMLVLDTARAALGLKAWYWQDIPSGGGGGGGTPAGNFGNVQLNRNGVFATPGSDSLDFESATGLSVKGNVNVTGLINAADGSSGNPSITFSTSDNEGFWLNGTGNLVMANQNQNIWQTNTAAMRIKSTVQLTFSSGDPTTDGADVGIARDGVGVARITNASTGEGDLKLKNSTFTGRNRQVQGADVASAAGAITLGADGNSFEITGTAAITLISNTNWQNGSEVTLLFTSTATLTDGTANSGTDIGMELSGNTNFTGSAGATLTLILSEIGGTQRWREKCRSVN